MKEEQSYWVEYKGGRGKGFAKVDRIVKATSKAEAKRKLTDEIPSAVVTNVEELVVRRRQA